MLFEELFIYYKDNIDNKDCSINTIFLNNMDKEYLKDTSTERKVIDYISGMTDEFILREYKKLKDKLS